MPGSHDDLVGALADRYRIERELGRGGMATVYLAHDVKHNRPVALKVITQSVAPGIGAERFIDEIRIAAQLSHPHILTLYDSGEAAGHPYYVMPYIAGESLRDRLRREHRLPVDEAVRLARELAEALEYAHRHGIVHRDIKPENILLHEGHAIVADFGIARALSEVADGVTQTGLVVGTPAYLSPEQLTGAAIDGRSDVYSLGCVLYECLAGHRAFASTASTEVIRQRLLGPPPSVGSRRAEVGAHLDHIIQTALAPDPVTRFQSAHAFAMALDDDKEKRGRAARPGIIVLPFANLSPEPDNGYFSDGLTEEIIADLSGIRSLSVISRTSAMQLKATTKDVRTIGRELGVQYVLEGSVRKAGKNLRITAQLIDAVTDANLWSEKYNASMDDVFEVQERLSREIVRALNLTLTTDEDRGLADRSIADPRAFELYLQARQEIRRLGDGPERAMRLLAAAVAIEGETAPLRGGGRRLRTSRRGLIAT